VTSGVRKHPPTLAVWLISGLSGSKPQQRCLRKVEVVHLEVEMRLLRLLLPGPLRRSIPLHTLEAQEEAARAGQSCKVVPGDIHRRYSRCLRVEGRQRRGIRTVKRHGAQRHQRSFGVHDQTVWPSATRYRWS
jgi:hypothetical protein